MNLYSALVSSTVVAAYKWREECNDVLCFLLPVLDLFNFSWQEAEHDELFRISGEIVRY